MKNKSKILLSLLGVGLSSLPVATILSSCSNNNNNNNFVNVQSDKLSKENIELITKEFNKHLDLINKVMSLPYYKMHGLYKITNPAGSHLTSPITYIFNTWSDTTYEFWLNEQQKFPWSTTVVLPDGTERTYYFKLTKKLVDEFFSNQTSITINDLESKNIYPLVISNAIDISKFKKFEVPNMVRIMSNPFKYYNKEQIEITNDLPTTIQYMTASWYNVKNKFYDCSNLPNLVVGTSEFYNTNYSKELVSKYPPKIKCAGTCDFRFGEFKPINKFIDIDTINIPNTVDTIYFTFTDAIIFPLLTNQPRGTINIPNSVKCFTLGGVEPKSWLSNHTTYDFTSFSSFDEQSIDKLIETLFPIKNVIISDNSSDGKVYYNTEDKNLNLTKELLLEEEKNARFYDYFYPSGWDNINSLKPIPNKPADFTTYFKFPISFKDRLECTGKYANLKGNPLYEIDNYQAWKDAGHIIYVDKSGNPVQ